MMRKNRQREDIKSDPNFDEYLTVMRRVHHRYSSKSAVPAEMLPPRDRHRNRESQQETIMSGINGNWGTIQEAMRIGTIASMVPDEIIYRHYDHSIRRYEAALMFIDVSGFTALCESYTKVARGGPSKLTQVLNSYIGAMVQEILTHNGDVLKFSGDAVLSMWKKTPMLTMQDVVHTAIDCGLIIQKNYGSYETSVGVKLKVKVAISAGLTHFCILGGEEMLQSNYVIVGQPVWDVKMAEYLSSAGDVLTTASAWTYVNEAEYCTQPRGDGRHTKVLGVGASWKRVEKMHGSIAIDLHSYQRNEVAAEGITGINYREFSLRPSVIAAMNSTWWPGLRRFMVTPVLRAVDNDEPMDFLTEVRRVVVIFLNIIMKAVTPEEMIATVKTAYQLVSSVTSASGGLVNKISLFDKDMMFVVVFGLRGLKHEDEAQNALLCASTVKENLIDDNIINISIGITSGTAYCGVVGHVLRREYTVIGLTVNKAARLMMAYPNKVTCDKETFLRSKLDKNYFKLVESKPLKGITKPGPIYEFNKTRFSKRPRNRRHPIIGRNDELLKYKAILENAMHQKHQRFTRHRDHKFAIAFIGPRMIGKTRLIDECLNITPNFVRVEKITLDEYDKVNYRLFRLILSKAFSEDNLWKLRTSLENMIRYCIDASALTSIQIHALNTIFDICFPLPDTYDYSEVVLSEPSVKKVLRVIFNNIFPEIWVVAVDETQYADDESWRLLILLLESKSLFLIIALRDHEEMSPEASKCLRNEMIVKVYLSGIDRIYHAALTCQLLDVQAIPADLEKVIESASEGLPGWIQNFVISLIQKGALSVVTVTRNQALLAGAVMPLPTLLQSNYDVNVSQSDVASVKKPSYQSVHSVASISLMGKDDSSTFTMGDSENIQMAVLADFYNFDNIKIDLTMDAIILKTYDSLTPYEKVLLKCASVLGEVFSRRMLLHLFECDSQRRVAEAVAKLFEIRVLECEGGEFTRETSMVLVHPAPALPAASPPYCACLGIRIPPNCQDLPTYAFCGYMKFCHSLFKTTTYELLTESQKLEMHNRALLFLERYTRRCLACGAGCFTKLLGLRIDDGLRTESEALKETRKQIQALSAETKIIAKLEPTSVVQEKRLSMLTSHFQTDLSNLGLEDTDHSFFSHLIENRSPRNSQQTYGECKRVRSFSSLDMNKCECMSILLFVYAEIIDHCRGAGQDEKLFEAYIEYVDINIINLNIPQAIRLLFELENLVTTNNSVNDKYHQNWVHQFRLARIVSLRGVCMLESGDLSEARKQLFHAMSLYYDPFPTSKCGVKFKNLQYSFRQMMALYIAPNWYVARDNGVVGHFYEGIAKTLNRMYRLFTKCREEDNAILAAKWALNYALRTNLNFRLLCFCYGDIINTYRQKQKFALCLKLEKSAVELCHRKRGQLDVTEVKAVSYLYTSIFLFYVECGKKAESLEFGLSVFHMSTNLIELSTRQTLVLCMLKLLLAELRIHDMVSLMREFFYMTDQYDLSSETWYYCYAVIILLDTGYVVETYNACERFYIKNGDAILRSQTPTAAWMFFTCMWLLTVRIGAWERSILWEEKIKHIVLKKFDENEFDVLILVRLTEGCLITLVQEMDNRNMGKVIALKKAIKSLFLHMRSVCDRTPMYRPRYYLLLAYNEYIKGKKQNAFSYLNKAHHLAEYCSDGILMIWVEHTQNHWRKTLNPKYQNYWVEHMEPENQLDYRDMDLEKFMIIPYTLPLPQDVDM